MTSLQVTLDVIDALTTDGQRMHVSTLSSVLSASFGAFRARELLVNLLEASVLFVRPDGTVMLSGLGQQLRHQLGEIVELTYELVEREEEPSELVVAVLRAVGQS